MTTKLRSDFPIGTRVLVPIWNAIGTVIEWDDASSLCIKFDSPDRLPGANEWFSAMQLEPITFSGDSREVIARLEAWRNRMPAIWYGNEYIDNAIAALRGQEDMLSQLWDINRDNNLDWHERVRASMDLLRDPKKPGDNDANKG